jgi:hypothetical protein
MSNRTNKMVINRNLNYNLFSICMIAEEVDVDRIISKLLENGGKDVKLLES